MIKAVIFDLDGVLLDNTSVIIKVFQEGARRSGVEVPDKKSIISTFGLPWQDMVEKLLGKDEKYKKIHRGVWAEYEDKMEFMSGMEEVLNRLKLAKAIVTSKPKDTAERQLKDVLHYFKFIIAKEDTKRHKPHPEPLLKALNKLDIKPHEAIYVGDYIRDFEMAKNAGTDFIGILSGAVSRKEFQKVGVKKLITSLNELIEIIENRF